MVNDSYVLKPKTFEHLFVTGPIRMPPRPTIRGSYFTATIIHHRRISGILIDQVLTDNECSSAKRGQHSERGEGRKDMKKDITGKYQIETLSAEFFRRKVVH